MDLEIDHYNKNVYTCFTISSEHFYFRFLSNFTTMKNISVLVWTIKIFIYIGHCIMLYISTMHVSSVYRKLSNLHLNMNNISTFLAGFFEEKIWLLK